MVKGWLGKKGWRTRCRSQRFVTLRAREPLLRLGRVFDHQGCLVDSRQRRGEEGSVSESEVDV